MKKFEIPSTTVKQIRFPDTVVKDINEAIKGTNCNFSAFVIVAAKVAISNINSHKKNRTVSFFLTVRFLF